METPMLIAPPPGIPRELLCGYLQRMRDSLPNLQGTLARLDFDAARVYGHRLKGSGGAYGVPQLSEIGAAIEIAAKAGKADELGALAERLSALLHAIEAA